MLPAQAFAANTRRSTWLDGRRTERQLLRMAWAHRRRAKALYRAGDGAAQAPGLTGALAPVTDAAVWTGTRIGDGFMGLWDRALAMMPEGAAPAWGSQLAPCHQLLLILQLRLIYHTAAACAPGLSAASQRLTPHGLAHTSA